MRTIQFKETWWNELRVKNNISYNELIEYTGYSMQTVASAFTGEHLPNDDLAAKLYELFDVDPVVGDLHFQEAHLAWVSETGKKAVQVNGVVAKHTNKDGSARKVTKARKYNTWWLRYIAELGISRAELAETLCMPASTLQDWLIGRSMPNIDNITRICDLFNLDVEEGKTHFQEAHDAFQRNRTSETDEVQDAAPTAGSQVSIFDEVAPETTNEPSSASDTASSDDVQHILITGSGPEELTKEVSDIEQKILSDKVEALEIDDLIDRLYGILGCDEFLAVYESLTKTYNSDALRYVYKKVDLSDFLKIKTYLEKKGT